MMQNEQQVWLSKSGASQANIQLFCADRRGGSDRRGGDRDRDRDRGDRDRDRDRDRSDRDRQPTTSRRSRDDEGTNGARGNEELTKDLDKMNDAIKQRYLGLFIVI